jgi:hypothetical protein
MKNGLVTWRNAGYKKIDSTVNQMIYLSHKIYAALANVKDVCFISLDATAAFDRVWHEGLLFKLKRIGISSGLLNGLNLTCQTGSSELLSKVSPLNGHPYLQVFHKDLFWGHYFLSYMSMTL